MLAVMHDDAVLLCPGWARAWIDGITEAQIKRRFDTSIDHCQQVVGLQCPVIFMD